MSTYPHQGLVAGGHDSKRTSVTGHDRIIAIAPVTRINTAVPSFEHDSTQLGVDQGDVISPRTAVSGQFKRLGIRSATMRKETTDQRRGRGQGQWEVYQDSGRGSQSPVVEETPEPVTSNDEANETTQNADATSRAKLPRPHMFEFKAGPKSTDTGKAGISLESTSASSVNSSFERSLECRERGSRSKRVRLNADEVPGTPTPSPEQREEVDETTPIVQAQVGQEALSSAAPELDATDQGDTAMSEPNSAEPPPPPPRAQSPSARKLSSVGQTNAKSKKRASPWTDSSDDVFPDPSLWWQDTEITGYDPTDPEEDDRGVNGVGYQKSRAQAARITQLRRKQIEEYRRREAREARAQRAGGRRGREVRTRSGGESPAVAKIEVSVSRPRAEVVKEVRFEVG